MQFQQDWPKDKKNYSSFNFLAENKNIAILSIMVLASRGIDNFSLSQLYMPYVNEKLSNSRVEICIFQKDRT